jgi:DNA-binding transcriptional LysR family regulator
MFTDYTLDQLTVFLAVVDEGSFSAAGRRLGRVQSAVSYAIGQLESAWGTDLFDRSKRAVRLTDAGERLVAEARLVVAQARELTETAARLQGRTEPALRVAVDALVPQEVLTQACAGLQQAFPHTTMQLVSGLLGGPLGAVRRGRADLGVCNLAGAESDPQLTVTHLGVVGLVAVCAPHHPLASEAAPVRGALLERHTQIVQSEGWRSSTDDQGVLGRRTWRVSDLSLKARLIRAGLGWGSLPREVAAPLLASGALVELRPEPWPAGGHRVSLHAVRRRDSPLGPAGQWLREQLGYAFCTGRPV